MPRSIASLAAEHLAMTFERAVGRVLDELRAEKDPQRELQLWRDARRLQECAEHWFNRAEELDNDQLPD